MTGASRVIYFDFANKAPYISGCLQFINACTYWKHSYSRSHSAPGVCLGETLGVMQVVADGGRI